MLGISKSNDENQISIDVDPRPLLTSEDMYIIYKYFPTLVLWRKYHQLLVLIIYLLIVSKDQSIHCDHV